MAKAVCPPADDPHLQPAVCPILIVAGTIVTAVGDEVSLMHPTGPVATEAAAVLIGGPLLFMLGGLLAKLAVFER